MTRKQLTRERTSHVQRLQRTAEEANIKLDGNLRCHGDERTRHDRGTHCRRDRSCESIATAPSSGKEAPFQPDYTRMSLAQDLPGICDLDHILCVVRDLRGASLDPI